MPKNVGPLDRRVRLALAAVLLVLALFAAHGVLAGVLLVAAAVLAATALVGTCPLYLPFGLSTNR